MSHLLTDGRWASDPLCAAVIWLITSICSSRKAASSSLSAVWAPSVSSREVGSDGKQHPSGWGCGVSPVPYPCWVGGPKIKSSPSVKSQSLKSLGWVSWIFWGRCDGIGIFSARSGCPFCASPRLCMPLGCLTGGVTSPVGTRMLHGTAAAVLAALRASLGIKHGADSWLDSVIRLQGKQYWVLRWYFLSALSWWVLLEDLGTELP